MLASTVHPQVRDVLSDDGLAGSRMGEAMIRALELQLELHNQQDAAYRDLIDEQEEDIILPVLKQHAAEDARGSEVRNNNGQIRQTLFAQAAIRIATELGQASDEDAQAVIKKVPLVGTSAFRSAVFQAVRLPYPVVSRALHFASKAASLSAPSTDQEREQQLVEIDEWIIRNEKYMRARLILDAPKTDNDGSQTAKESDSAVRPSKRQRMQPDDQSDKDGHQTASESEIKLGIDRSSSHWKHFMVGLGRDAMQVFGARNAEKGTIIITRPNRSDLPGLLILDEQRKDEVQINMLSAFVRRFESMTRHILKGLDWSNVMIAGGLPLAVLTSVTDEQAEQYEGSDIDLYLFGLGREEATAKLQEIEKVFAANLPINTETGEKMKYAVLRNSQTVTFVPEVYPNRRVQVILKLCPNPMAVLLNFDLDQVGVAFDGSEVWMLPRTARAIITSYTVFTMDLIHGSFLSSRKATQDQRVFKYAKRGYGLRFLPSYIGSLPQATVSILASEDTDAKETSLTQDVLQITLLEERKRVGWWLAQRDEERFSYGPDAYSMSMREMDSRATMSPELAERSSLSGWQNFARHVAFWEYSQMGYFPLDLKSEGFCAVQYEDDPLSYQDGPEFSWDVGFTLEQLRQNVGDSIQREAERFDASLVAFRIHPYRGDGDMSDEAYTALKADHEARHLGPRQTLQRTIVASTLAEAFSQPLVAFVHLPRNLRTHVEPRLSDTSSRLGDVTLPGAPAHKPIPPYDWITAEHQARIRTDADFVLTYWIQDGSKDGQLTPHWQLVDREADEVHEIIHAFRRGHRDLNVGLSSRNKQTCTSVSRRLVRPTDRSERLAFKAWACERASERAGWYGAEHNWAMFNVSQAVVFRRFKTTAEEAEDAQRNIGFEEDDGAYDTAPKTAEEWVATARRHSDRPSPDWVRWYKCRLPPAHLLGEIQSLAG